MTKLFEREYYKIEVAASELGCTVDDLIHWASIGRIKLGVLFDVDGFFLENYFYLTDAEGNCIELPNSDKLESNFQFTGFAYVDSGYFQSMEVRGGDLIFNCVELLNGRIIGIAPFAEQGEESRSIDRIYIHSIDLRQLVAINPATRTEKPMTVANRAHVSDRLAKTNQAATKFWTIADRNDRATHPDNATVTAWLMQQGFSQSLADKAATIIRPEWAPTGRKPEE